MSNSIDIPHLARLFSVACGQEVDPADPETLVGAFQKLRPDGKSVPKIFERVLHGSEISDRLLQVYQAAGEGRRSDGMKDAYFIVRHPQQIDPIDAHQLTKAFFSQLRELAIENGDGEFATVLDSVTKIRVIEGKAPKHPKAESEKSDLLVCLEKSGPTILDTYLNGNEIANFLWQAMYFMACDSFLRHYLLWPVVAERSHLEDPFASYFKIWSHGAKYRIFNNSQVDLYLPRVF